MHKVKILNALAGGGVGGAERSSGSLPIMAAVEAVVVVAGAGLGWSGHGKGSFPRGFGILIARIRSRGK